jgi:2-desacetyl-2-hydroxyethyl bacteriochlorophyllide A dehydrogenase
MRGIWLEEGRLSVRDDLPEPRPAAGEALVRVRLAGICGTDLELVQGYYPYTGIPGHEFVGVVESCEAIPALVGRRVVGEINAACGRCATCRAGRPTHCPDRTVLGIVGRDGAFAERLRLPAVNLHPVPDHVDDDAAVFVEPLAAAARILEQVTLGRGDRVLVVGAGRLGLLVAMVLARTGCRLEVVARQELSRRLLDAVGISAVAVANVPAGAFDVAVEASGSPSGFEVARASLRPRGTLVLKSTYADRLALDVSRIVVDELTLVASRCGPFTEALRLLAEGEVDPRPLIRGRLPLERAMSAFEEAARPGALKWLLVP